MDLMKDSNLILISECYKNSYQIFGSCSYITQDSSNSTLTTETAGLFKVTEVSVENM